MNHNKDVTDKVLMGWRAVAREHNLTVMQVATIAIMLVEACIKIMSVDRADALKGVDVLTDTMRKNLNKIYDEQH